MEPRRKGDWLESRMAGLKACLRSCIENPGDCEAVYRLGEEYFWLGRYREASDAYMEVIRLRPDFAYAYFNYGYACLILGDRVTARKSVRVLKSLNSALAGKLLKAIQELPAPRGGAGKRKKSEGGK